MKRNLGVGLGVVFAIAIIMVLILQQGPQQDGAITVGLILPLSGDAAVYGKALQTGAELAFEELNTTAEASGKQLRPVYEDSKADPKTAVSALAKLTSVDRVPIIIGDMFSSTTLAIAPIAQKNRVVLVSPTASALAVPRVGDYVFTIYPSDAYDGQFLAEHLAALWPSARSVAVVYAQAEAMITCKDAFKKALPPPAAIVTEEAVPPDTRDLSPVVLNVLRSTPDVVLIVAQLPETAMFVKQAREKGLTSRFLAISTCYDPKIFEIAGDSAKDLVFSAPFFDVEGQTPHVAHFVTAYEQKYNDKPNVWAAYGYDVVKIVASALSASTKTLSLRDIMATLPPYDGVTGRTVFNPDRTVTKTLRLLIADPATKTFAPAETHAN